MRETIRTLEETEVDKIWTDLLPLFIVVGILIIAGILLLCEKIRETLIEKDEMSVTDGPPSYDDLSINHGQIDGEEARTPPPPYRNIEPPSYEFINRAFELDEAPPPPYIVETHTTFVNWTLSVHFYCSKYNLINLSLHNDVNNMVSYGLLERYLRIELSSSVQ